MKKAILFTVAVGISVCCAYAQNVKYKDLYFLLDTKKYDDAEPFLRQFLKDSKNVDHPNANFQMAVVFQEKAKKNDVILETEVLTAHIDSAIMYYRNALTYIDEKEVKRNDEYYIAYKRRDIRTGKFGIKLADVQFDIEKKIEGLNEQKSKVSELKGYYANMVEAYKASQEKFWQVQAAYPKQKILFLQADVATLKELDAVKSDYVQAIENFDRYKASMGKIAGAGYDQSLIQKEILDYNKDGVTSTDFQADIINFWNYGAWADNSKDVIKNEIFPLKEKIVGYDKKLNALEAEMVTDSVSVLAKLSELSSKLMADQLKQFDPAALPLAVFALKEANLKYHSQLIENSGYKDSVNVLYKLEVVEKGMKALNVMDSVVNLLVGKNLETESLNYKHYIDTQFQGSDAFQAFVKEKLDFTIDELRAMRAEHERVVERSRWLIDEKDSIPLFNVAQSKAGYVPLTIEEKLTTGLYFSGEEPIKGYFAMVEPSRVPKTKIKFEVGKDYFSKENLGSISSKTIADEAGHIYYVVLYTQKPEQETYAAVINKIYSSDGLSWTKNVDLLAAPINLSYDASSGDFIVEYDTKNYSGTNGALPKALVLDKKGNIKN